MHAASLHEMAKCHPISIEAFYCCDYPKALRRLGDPERFDGCVQNNNNENLIKDESMVDCYRKDLGSDDGINILLRTTVLPRTLYTLDRNVARSN